MKIGLVDYGAGNLQSVRNALRALGRDSVVVTSGEGLSDGVEVVIFPGVGAFGDSMRHLRDRGLVDPLREWIRGGDPFFGICIGYQVLFHDSEESPGVEGLGIFSGRVIRLRAPGLKIPHMGWNEVWQSVSHPLWSGIPDGARFYFVHSYFCEPRDPALTAARSRYPHAFTSAIARDNIFATQFHPEKSSAAGLRLLENFTRWSP